MSTAFYSTDKSDTQLGTSFRENGNQTLQLELTPTEFKTWLNEQVIDEYEHLVGTLGDLVETFKGKVVFDTAARRNGFARHLEEHRFFDDSEAMQNTAKRFRDWAKVAARDAIHVVG